LSLVTSILTTDAEFDAIRAEWDELLEASDQRVFFLRWHWNRIWWRRLASPASRLMLFAYRNGDGTLVGLSPMYLCPRRYFGCVVLRELCFLGTGTDVRTSEYADVIVRRGWEVAVARAFAASLLAREGWDRLFCWGMPADSVMLPLLQSEMGPRSSVEECERTHFLDTSGTWNETKRWIRHDVDRMLRRALSGERSKVVRVERLDEIGGTLDSLVRLHQRRWQSKGQPGSFADPRFEQFLREVAQSSFERGQLGLWCLHAGGRPVAALIAFVDFQTVHYFQSGFEPESRASLGQVAIGLAVRDCVAADGINRFDFMSGHGSYKSEWSSSHKPLLRLEHLRPGIRSSFFVWMNRQRRQLVRYRRALRRWMRGQPWGSLLRTRGTTLFCLMHIEASLSGQPWELIR
jgi:CelD/BcsL family acetyltransferase involved in cellulose biosynthesis